MTKPALFPIPREIIPLEGVFSVPQAWWIDCEDKELYEGIGVWREDLAIKTAESTSKANLVIFKDVTIHTDGYRIEMEEGKIFIFAGQADGIFRALAKIWQLFRFEKPGNTLPCLKISDRPMLKRRGFMLDISRCKVPTMEELFRLIDLLALIGYNELQLYIEHTFRFRDHEEVWKDASPISPAEIQEIDRYCKDRFIELVPNLNSFGHFERWLRHPTYKHMAECPDGFVRENPYIKRDHGSTLKPNQQSLDFIASLYEEYLPNFSSKKFNVGLDEPWELGQGWSKEKVEEVGKGQVYLGHLEGIRKLVEKHGKHMQFWSDVLLEDPENAKLLDKHASPIIWGYEPTHPFEEQAAAIAACGLDFCLAPGTGTWKSFTGRWPIAQKNIELSCVQAKKHGAEGILLTSWGDGGNHQPWPTMYPGIFQAAQWSWSGQSLPEENLAEAIDAWVYDFPGARMGQSILKLGRLGEEMDSYIANSSLHWTLLFGSKEERFKQFLEEHGTAEKMIAGLVHLEESEKEIESINMDGKVLLSRQELQLGVEMTRISLQRGKSLLEGQEFTHPNQEAMVREFEKLWLKRARPGGLQEASGYLREALI